LPLYKHYNVTAQKTATLSKAKVLQRNRDSEVCHLEFPFSLKGMTFPPGSTCVGTQVSLPHLRRDQHGPGHVPIFCIGINWIDALASDLLGQCQELIRFLWLYVHKAGSSGLPSRKPCGHMARAYSIPGSLIARPILAHYFM
jgi:hypothetical protein